MDPQSNNHLQNFKDQMALRLFGLTVLQAREKGVCISCKENFWNIVGENPKTVDLDEWAISGLCPECFKDFTEGK